jgi:hypothetical protein
MTRIRTGGPASAAPPESSVTAQLSNYAVGVLQLNATGPPLQGRHQGRPSIDRGSVTFKACPSSFVVEAPRPSSLSNNGNAFRIFFKLLAGREPPFDHSHDGINVVECSRMRIPFQMGNVKHHDLLMH